MKTLFAALLIATLPGSLWATTHEVTMTGTLNYNPSRLEIEAGDTVIWRNTSGLMHTVTADPALANDPSHVALPINAETFNSGNISPGTSYTRTFDVPGDYKYFCIPHESSGMIGEITV